MKKVNKNNLYHVWSNGHLCRVQVLKNSHQEHICMFYDENFINTYEALGFIVRYKGTGYKLYGKITARIATEIWEGIEKFD